MFCGINKYLRKQVSRRESDKVDLVIINGLKIGLMISHDYCVNLFIYHLFESRVYEAKKLKIFFFE